MDHDRTYHRSVGLIGAGNMAAAMVEGLLAASSFVPAEISCLGGTGKSAPELAYRTGIRLAVDLEDLCRDADALVVAFKPQHLAKADARLAELTRGRLVISVLAGRRLASLALAFPHARNLVRTMPNTPGQIGAGITGWTAQRPLSAADASTLANVLGALGQSIEVAEADLDALTAVSGSGPAYVFEFAAALREAGHELVGTHPEGELAPSDLASIPRLAIVLGNEHDGIHPDVAERLVVLGFFNEVIERMPDIPAVSELRRKVAEKLAGKSGAK